MSLSIRYAEVLAFEAAGPWRYDSSKESAVRERFGWSLTRYYQVLLHATRLPAADRFDPTTVRRIRAHHAALRDRRRLGFEATT